MNEPDFNIVFSKLLSVKDDLTLREEVADWAQEYVTNDELTVSDDRAWDLLMILSGIDTQINPGEYLYGKEDIIGWVKEFS